MNNKHLTRKLRTLRQMVGAGWRYGYGEGWALMMRQAVTTYCKLGMGGN